MALEGIFAAAMASGAAPHDLSPDGRALYHANCAACHGDDGRGRRSAAQLGFDLPLPNFTDCKFAATEATSDWSSTIHRGGPRRAFSRMMPAFGEALSDAEIEAIAQHMRGFCTEKSWPVGDLNFPMALNTEKAFPEDEVVLEPTINMEGSQYISTRVTVEKRIWSTSEVELYLPLTTATIAGRSRTGIGDVGVGWKQNLFANAESGTIFSMLGELSLPTANVHEGLGTRYAVFEPSVLLGQALPYDFIFQGQIYSELPTEAGRVQSVGWSAVLQRSFAEDGGWGRAWTPMIEVLGAQNLNVGAKTNWTLVPQLQVSLSQRQHILFSAGAKIPMTSASIRNTQFMSYILWDWNDGGLFDGWQ